MSKKELHFEAAVTLEQAIYYLTQLSDALKAGPVRIATGEREIVISPRDILGMELEVSQKRDKSKLALELSWREYPAADLERLLRIEPAPLTDEDEDEADDEDTEAPRDEHSDADDNDDRDDDRDEQRAAGTSDAEAAPAADSSAAVDADAPSRPMRLA